MAARAKQTSSFIACVSGNPESGEGSMVDQAKRIHHGLDDGDWVDPFA
jgi:hypothetical protein